MTPVPTTVLLPVVIVCLLATGYPRNWGSDLSSEKVSSADCRKYPAAGGRLNGTPLDRLVAFRPLHTKNMRVTAPITNMDSTRDSQSRQVISSLSDDMPHAAVPMWELYVLAMMASTPKNMRSTVL